MAESDRTIRPLEERLSLSEAAAERIREAIQDGVYRQGERLSDSRIATELGVSRGSIREALKLLQSDGIVVQKAHRGTYVMSPTADDILGACEVRVALECHAVRMLAAAQPPADVSRLRRLVDEIEKALADGDQATVSRLDRDFHEIICLLGAHPRVREVFLRESVPMLGFFGADAEAFQPLSEMVVELGPLTDCMEEGRWEEAVRLMEAHLRRAAHVMVQRGESKA